MSGRLSRLQIDNVGSLSRSTVDECVERLQEGATVVVSSRRLQHLIEDGYNRARLNLGERSWPGAEVHVWQIWLSNLWAGLQYDSGDTLPQLLASAQSLQVWEKEIADDIRQEYHDEFEYLLWHITATATRARRAYGLMQEYGIEHTQFGDSISLDATQFLRWLEKYRQHLKQGNLIDTESLPDVLCPLARDIRVLNPGKLVVAGFVEWTPQHQRLLDSLSEFGEVERLHYESGIKPRRLDQIRFEKVDDEIELCARWTRSVIEADPTNHRVGIVAPRLGNLRDRIIRRFSALLNPDQVMDRRELQNLSFHVTLGSALIDTPVVVDALNLLELTQSEVNVSVLCSVIQSDRIRWWDMERSQRARLKSRILGLGHSELSLKHVQKLIDSENLKCRRLSRILKRADDKISGMPKSADYAYWGSFLMDWMRIFQSEERDNREFGVAEKQAHESLSAAIEELAQLGFVSSKVSLATAVAKLRRSLAQISVQPRAARVPIQIGDLDTMVGQSFSHLWMLGMNNVDLPGTPQPNPFIPVSLQKQMGIPQSSASLLERSVTEQIDVLLSGAVDVVQSYAVIDGKSFHQPSSHLKNLKTISSNDQPDIGDYMDYRQRVAKERNACRIFNDWKAPKVADPQDIRGGSSLLKNQSQCPFRAFAQHRLHVPQSESAGIGISAISRGLLAHQMFEGIYTEITSRTMTEDREKYLQVAQKFAQQAMDELVAGQVKPINADLSAGEVDRMVDLARQWLAAEYERGNFNVFATEQAAELKLSDLVIRLKIDRIDKEVLEDDEEGGAIVIDYKTGECSIRNLQGSRPKDPQLLTYVHALTQQDIPVTEIAYAKVKRGGVRFQHLEVSIKLVEQIRVTLEQIARRFLDGEADADPLPRACNYCHIKPICRIDDRSDHVARRESDKA
ncbi:MAG: exodeoxyribonuclease V subunit gamma [Acidiferrobacterales bacterium]|nr:exodeoxyribonuclease V subunit gamma [Acidiferrobacterales bacterium]